MSVMTIDERYVESKIIMALQNALVSAGGPARSVGRWNGARLDRSDLIRPPMLLTRVRSIDYARARPGGAIKTISIDLVAVATDLSSSLERAESLAALGAAARAILVGFKIDERFSPIEPIKESRLDSPEQFNALLTEYKTHARETAPDDQERP